MVDFAPGQVWVPTDGRPSRVILDVSVRDGRTCIVWARSAPDAIERYRRGQIKGTQCLWMQFVEWVDSSGAEVLP